MFSDIYLYTVLNQEQRLSPPNPVRPCFYVLNKRTPSNIHERIVYTQHFMISIIP